MKFKVIKGTHDHFGTIYSEGQVIECDSDLAKIFKNKFERVGDGENQVFVTPPPPEVPVKGKEVAAPEVPAKKAVAKANGMNVSRLFKDAVENGLTVLRRGVFYFVFESEEVGPEAEALNEKGMSKKEVEPFIKKYLEE